MLQIPIVLSFDTILHSNPPVISKAQHMCLSTFYISFTFQEFDTIKYSRLVSQLSLK